MHCEGPPRGCCRRSAPSACCSCCHTLDLRTPSLCTSPLLYDPRCAVALAGWGGGLLVQEREWSEPSARGRRVTGRQGWPGRRGGAGAGRRRTRLAGSSSTAVRAGKAAAVARVCHTQYAPPAAAQNPEHSGGAGWAAATGQDFVRNHAIPTIDYGGWVAVACASDAWCRERGRDGRGGRLCCAALHGQPAAYATALVVRCTRLHCPVQQGRGTQLVWLAGSAAQAGQGWCAYHC